eukprot:4799756-Amphidinium_carterae.3
MACKERSAGCSPGQSSTGAIRDHGPGLQVDTHLKGELQDFQIYLQPSSRSLVELSHATPSFYEGCCCGVALVRLSKLANIRKCGD